MKATVPYRTFLDALKRIAGVALGKSDSIQLCNVLIEIRGTSIMLTGNNLETCVRQTIPAVVLESGSIAVGAGALLTRVSSLPEEEIELETVKGSWLKIKAAGIVFDISGLAGDDFPPVPEVDGSVKSLTLSQADIKRAFNLTAFAASKNEDLKVITGVHVEVEPEGVTFVGTDGRRLATVEVKCEHSASGAFTLPRKSVRTLRSCCNGAGNVRITFNDRLVRFLVEEGVSDKQPTPTGLIVVTSKLLSGLFPGYRQALPKTHGVLIGVDRQVFGDALRRACIVASESIGTDLTVADGKMEIRTTASGGTALEIVQVNGEGRYAGRFNPHIIEEPFSEIDFDTINVAFPKKPMEPMEVRTAGFRYVVMPMINPK